MEEPDLTNPPPPIGLLLLGRPPPTPGPTGLLKPPKPICDPTKPPVPAPATHLKCKLYI